MKSFMSAVLLLLDINECANEMDNNCTQMCQNEIGSYSCGCNIGYTLDSDGYTCNGKSTIQISSHNFRYCIIIIIVIIIIKLVVLLLLDFDECVNEMDNNCAQMCQNTNGSYSCECRDGYSLASNGYSCSGKSTLMSTIILFL